MENTSCKQKILITTFWMTYQIIQIYLLILKIPINFIRVFLYLDMDFVVDKSRFR